MERADDWLTKSKPVSEIFKGKVIKNDTGPGDRTVNDMIQEQGAEIWGGANEVAWYRRHKGYSKKIGEANEQVIRR